MQYRTYFFIIILTSSVFSFINSPRLCLAAEPAVESYFWPPGFFLDFSKLKQAQKEITMSEVENKLAFLRQTGKGLLVRGDLMNKVQTNVQELNPATILDQSGFVILVNNFPNIYFNFTGPQTFVSRNTFIVAKNPKVDRLESIIRQSLVLTGEFFAFSQTYLKSTVENLQKALRAQSEQGQFEGRQPETGKKIKRR